MCLFFIEYFFVIWFIMLFFYFINLIIENISLSSDFYQFFFIIFESTLFYFDIASIFLWAYILGLCLRLYFYVLLFYFIISYTLIIDALYLLFQLCISKLKLLNVNFHCSYLLWMNSWSFLFKNFDKIWYISKYWVVNIVFIDIFFCLIVHFFWCFCREIDLLSFLMLL